MHPVHKNRTGQPWDKPGHDDLNQLPRPYRCDTDVAELPQEKQP
jgi:hypothetical protein